MRELPFTRTGPLSLRVQSVGTVRNDLAIVVSGVTLHDPKEERNGVVQTEVPGPFQESAVVELLAFKGFGATYQPSVLDLAARFSGEEVWQAQAGFAATAQTVADGYYPLATFVLPSDYTVTLGELPEGQPARVVFDFGQRNYDVRVLVPDPGQKEARWRYARRDRVQRVLLLEGEEALPTQ